MYGGGPEHLVVDAQRVSTSLKFEDDSMIFELNEVKKFRKATLVETVFVVSNWLSATDCEMEADDVSTVVRCHRPYFLFFQDEFKQDR